MEEKKYYIYGGFGLAVILLVFTVFSFFSAPKYASNKTVDGVVAVNGKVEEKVYPKPDIILTNSKEENSSIKFIKPSNLPSTVQSVIDSDFEKKKSGVSSSIRIENSSPEIYQSGEYVSIVTVFSKYNENVLQSKVSSSWTYSQETKNIVSLPQVLESENKNNEVYIYLADVFKTSVVRKTSELIDEVNGGSSMVSVEKKVEEVLLPEEKNFSTWYLNANQLFLIFDSNNFIPYSFVLYDSYGFEEQKTAINFWESKNYLKVHSNSNK
ncbi:MAG: hypothetical protein WCX30_01105 [Candidatus Paceibacterota bacterium]|jgi:hypothetical protein|nr:hypothetical protein [bacterium]